MTRFIRPSDRAARATRLWARSVCRGVKCEIDGLDELQVRAFRVSSKPRLISETPAGGSEEIALESCDHVGVADGPVAGRGTESARGMVQVTTVCGDRRQPGEALGAQPGDHVPATDPELLLERGLRSAELACEERREPGVAGD